MNYQLQMNEDYKITFNSNSPLQKINVYKLDKKPNSYDDFKKGIIYEIKNPYEGGFEDLIQTNLKYYYIFESENIHGLVSNVSEIYQIEIIKDSGAIYPVVKIFEFEGQKSVKEMSFRENFAINVNYANHILANEAKDKVKNLKDANDIKSFDMFGTATPPDSIYNKNFKIRITSKTTKKKIDINLSFNRELKDLT